jgi:fatty acid desaturase
VEAESDDVLKSFEVVRPWRFWWDWLWTVVPVFGLIYLCEQVSFLFYIPAVYLIGSRIFRLALLGHEGVHGLLFRSSKWNTFVARYLCHFPVMISFSRYRAIHLLHHRFVGEGQDPDGYIYQGYPICFRTWLKRTLVGILIGRALLNFFEYFTEVPVHVRKLFGRPEGRQLLVKSDFSQYLIFWCVVLLTIIYFEAWYYFALYYLVPAYLLMPFNELSNAYQHGAYSGKAQSRSQTLPYGLMEFIFPLHLNFHFEHHLNSRVPHYNLPVYSRALKARNRLPQENVGSFTAATRLIFR